MKRLEGKRALVTGGTSGIGLAAARELAAEGARVAVTGTSAASIEAAQKELGPDVLVLRSDAGSPEDQKALAKKLGEAFGQLDVVFLNAGVAEFRPLEAWDEAAFDRSMNVNFKGPFFLMQALSPILAKPASVVLNTSINAHIGMPSSSVYSATKGALLTLAKTLSGELVGRGVRVNAISPGPIASGLQGKLGMDDAAKKQLAGQIPLGRFGQASEIAKTVVFLASDEAAFIVGSEIVIDGGMSTL